MTSALVLRQNAVRDFIPRSSAAIDAAFERDDRPLGFGRLGIIPDAFSTGATAFIAATTLVVGAVAGWKLKEFLGCR